MFEEPLKSQSHISLKSRNGIDDLSAFDIHLYVEGEEGHLPTLTPPPYPRISISMHSVRHS